MDRLSREKIESSLLYSTAAAYLLRSTSYSKLAATTYLLATTLFLRPRPEQPDLLKNGLYSLCSLVDGVLFWKAIEPLLHLKITARLPLNGWTLGAAAWTAGRIWEMGQEVWDRPAGASPPWVSDQAIWSVLHGCKLVAKEEPTRVNFVPDTIRWTIESNLLYSALFALSLNSSHPKLYPALLILGTTFLFRPDETAGGRLVAHAAFACAHLIDGYLFHQLCANSFQQLLNPWTITASLWGAGRLYTLFSPQLSKKLNQHSSNTLWGITLKSLIRHPLEIHMWAISNEERLDWQNRLKYSALFALCMQSSLVNRYSLSLALATTFFIRPPPPPLRPHNEPPISLVDHATTTLVHLIDSFFFWQAVAPLSAVCQLKQLTPSLCLWAAGAVGWSALTK